MKKFAFLVSLLVITSLSFSQLATNKHATHISNKIKKKHKSKSLNTYIIDSSYRFNWVNSSWNLASKSNYTYDNTHSEIASTTSNFSNNKFSLSDKITYNNDPIIGSDTLDYEYSWDTISKNWNQTQKYEFAYCKDLATIDNDSLEIDYTFSNNTWVNSLKYTYTYDQYGLDSVDVDYSWNGTTWNETNRYFTIGHAYTINGDDSLIVFSKWDYINKKQVLSDKQEYFYDANNTLTSIVYSVWDINSKKWIYDSKVDYTYDANDNEIQRLYSNWNTTNSTWENNYKIVNYFSLEKAGIKSP